MATRLQAAMGRGLDNSSALQLRLLRRASNACRMSDDAVEAVDDYDKVNRSSSSRSMITLCTFAKLCALVFGGLTIPVMGMPSADDTTSHSRAPCQ